jgi:hypothetical protein
MDRVVAQLLAEVDGVQSGGAGALPVAAIAQVKYNRICGRRPQMVSFGQDCTDLWF